MTGEIENSEYKDALAHAKGKYLRKFEKLRQDAAAQRAERAAERIAHKKVCLRQAPQIVSWIREIVAERQGGIGQLCALAINEETHGYFKVDENGSLVTDESGKNITDDEWLTGATVLVIPYGSSTLADEVNTMRNLFRSDSGEHLDMEQIRPHEIDQANFNRSTARVTILIAADNSLLLSAEFSETRDESKEVDDIGTLKRVESLEFTEYYELEEVDRDFIDRQIERFLISCFTDEKTMDLAERIK